MSEPQSQEVSTIKPGRIFTFVVFVCMAAAIAYLYSKDGPSKDSGDDVASMKAELENANELILQLKEAELHRERDQLVAESRLAGSRQSLQTASDTITKLEKAITQWTTTTSSLMTGPQGMRLAASPAALEQAEAILQAARPSENLPATLRARLEPLEKLVETAQNAEKEQHVSFDPGPTFTAQLDAIKAEAEPALKVYQDHNRRLEAVLAGLPENSPESESTLEEALQARKNERLQEENRLLAEELEKVREESAEKRREDEAIAKRRADELDREEQQKKREQEELQRQAEIAGIDADNKQLGQDIAAALARKKLEREFAQDLPQIKSLLSPFITEGRTQPEQGFFRQSTQVGPVSLGKLNSERLLSVSIDDQRRLWYMAAGGKNDRQLGGFPTYIGNATDWQAKQPTVQKAQALLIKYGELMVEKKMLTP